MSFWEPLKVGILCGLALNPQRKGYPQKRHVHIPMCTHRQLQKAFLAPKSNSHVPSLPLRKCREAGGLTKALAPCTRLGGVIFAVRSTKRRHTENHTFKFNFLPPLPTKTKCGFAVGVPLKPAKKGEPSKKTSNSDGTGDLLTGPTVF